MPQPVPLRPVKSGVPTHLGKAEAELFATITRAYHLRDEVSRTILEEGLASLQRARLARETLARDGTLADFIAMGAVVGTPGCGSCCGTCAPIPGDGVHVISTANRNFKGRMGNAQSLIYLASPASCAAAAVRGAIVDPREIL